MNIGIYLCTCKRTSSIDVKKVRKGLDASAAKVHDHLCGEDGRSYIVDDVRRLDLDAVVVGCTEKAHVFEDDLAGFEGVEVFPVNLREHCGWVHPKKEATEKASRMLSAALLEINNPPRVETLSVDVGSDVLILGSSPALERAFRGLSNLMDVTLVNPQEIKEISGSIGDLKVRIVKNPIDGDRCIQCGECADACPLGAIDGLVVGESCDRCGKCIDVCPVDAIAFDTEEELKAGQIIVDSAMWGDKSRWGIYLVEAADHEGAMDTAFDALANIGTVKKIKYIHAEPDDCASGKSGFIGCTICEDTCAHGAISRKEDSVAFDEISCFGCGSCAAVCPISVPKLLDFPDDLVFSRLEALLGGNLKTLMFTCTCGSDILDEIGKDKVPYPPVLPFFVPCLGAVSELHILKAFQLGAEGVVFLKGRSCQHGVEGPTNTFKFADVALGSLGLGGRLEFIDGAEDVPSRLNSFVKGLSTSPLAKRQPASIAASDKREFLVELLRDLSKGTGKTPSLVINDTEFPFGTPVLKENCTVCAACTNMCPTGALSGEGSNLDFKYDRCIFCGLCAKACPEDAISIENVLDPGRLIEGYTERLFSAPMACCEQCKKEYATEAMVKSAKARIIEAGAETVGEFSMEDQLRLMEYCEDCRPLVAISIQQEQEYGD